MIPLLTAVDVSVSVCCLHKYFDSLVPVWLFPSRGCQILEIWQKEVAVYGASFVCVQVSLSSSRAAAAQASPYQGYIVSRGRFS